LSKSSFKWMCVFAGITFAFVFQPSHDVLMEWTKNHPYIMGFLKFSILAFLGELLGIRISCGNWNKPKGIVLRIFAWGSMGMAVAFVLPMSYMSAEIFLSAGQQIDQQLARAFIASVVFNLLPGPMVIIYHKMAESWIDLGEGNASALKKVGFSAVIRNVGWENLIKNILLKVNLILFIPINTIVFLLPMDLRVLMAAYSSILLGVVLGYRKAKQIGSGQLATHVETACQLSKIQ